MAHDTQNLLTDAGGRPIPQYYNPAVDLFEPVHGAGGAASVRIEDGAHVAIGSKADPVAGVDLSEEWSLVSLFKAVVTELRTSNTFQAWQSGAGYVAGDWIIHGGNYYYCTANHTAAAGNEPGVGGSWTAFWTDAGAGAVTGPVSSTDRAVAFFSGTTGAVIASHAGVKITTGGALEVVGGIRVNQTDPADGLVVLGTATSGSSDIAWGASGSHYITVGGIRGGGDLYLGTGVKADPVNSRKLRSSFGQSSIQRNGIVLHPFATGDGISFFTSPSSTVAVGVNFDWEANVRMRLTTTGRLLLGTAPVDDGVNRLQVAGPGKFVGTISVQTGGQGIIVGADTGATTLTDATTKIARIGAPHYTLAQKPMAMIVAIPDQTTNKLLIGGGTSSFHAATEIVFYTGVDTVTSPGAIRATITGAGNFGLGANPTYGNGAGVLALQNATSVPNQNPSNGGVLYAEGGALKWRGSSGTVTTIAPA